MPRSNEPPTSAEMEDPPISGVDCGCRHSQDEGLTLCPLHDAAPELLEACRLAQDAVNAGYRDRHTSDCRCVRCTAMFALHAAIAKATT